MPFDPSAPGGTPAAKAVLRAALVQARTQRMPVPGEDEARTAAVLALDEVAATDTVAGYWSMAGEPPTPALLDDLAAAGKRILLPVLLPDSDLEFRAFDGTLVTGRLGLSCPPPSAPVVPLAQAGVVLVPALACARDGRRLGRGGGSYDRALPRAAPGAMTLGIVHTEELRDEIPTDAHDQRVSAVLAGAALVRVART